MIASLLVLAMTFSSDLTGAMMRLPAWMQTMRIAAGDTFGTVEHAESSRRVTKTTVAAVIAAPAAFYERAYYVSEGRTNAWDVEQYGPLTPSPDSFTNGFNASPFYIPHGVGDPPLMVTNTLRLVEYDNIRRVYQDGMSSLIDDREDGRLPLARPSWDSDVRRVWWSHSEMPDSEAPAVASWCGTLEFSQLFPEKWFIPLAACGVAGDALHEKEFTPVPAWRRDSVVRQFLREVTFREPGDEGDLGVMVGYVGYEWYSNTVADVISRSFRHIGSGPLSYLTRYDPMSTRRLTPDEYVDIDISVQREYIDSFSVTIYDEPWEPWNELSKEYLYENFFGYDEVYADYARAEFTAPFTRGKIRAGYPIGDYETVVSRVFDFALPDVPEGADVLVFEGASPLSYIDVQSSNYWESAEGTYIASAGWDWDLEPNEVTLDAYESFVVTNGVYTNASEIAGACRAAAVMDRTFEIAQKRDAYYGATEIAVRGDGSLTNLPKVVRATAELKVIGTLPDVGAWVEMDLWFGADEKFDLPSYKQSDMEFSAFTNRPSAPADHDVVWFDGSYASINGFSVWARQAFNVNFQTNGIAVTELFAPDIVPPGEYHRARLHTLAGGEDGLTVYLQLEVDLWDTGAWVPGVAVPAAYCSPILAELTNFLAEVKVEADVSGTYNAYFTDPLDYQTAQDLYAFAGPSPSCFSAGKVRSAFRHSAGGVICERVKENYVKQRGESWPILSNPYNLVEHNYVDDPREQDRKYRIFHRFDYGASVGWLSEVVNDRKATRDRCLSVVSAATGVDLMNPSSVLRVEDGMLTGDGVSGYLMRIPGSVSVTVSPQTGSDYYVKRVGDKIELRRHPDDESPAIDTVSVNVQFGSLAMPFEYVGDASVEDQDVKDGYEFPPAAANGKESTILTTDWKWKALGIED